MGSRFQKVIDPYRLIYFIVHSVVIFGGWMAIALADSENQVLIAIGASMVATGIAGCISFLYVRLLRENRERIEDIRQSGLMRVFAGRSVAIPEEYDQRLASASEAVDIMGFGLKHLREDHASNFEAWASRLPVRILVIDPEFPSEETSYAAQRDSEEGDDRGKISSDVRKLLEQTKSLLLNDQVNFSIRLYRCLPSVNIFRIDNYVFWGPYFVDEVSRNMPTFLLDGSGYLSKEVRKHFDIIWNSETLSRDVPKKWLE